MQPEVTTEPPQLLQPLLTTSPQPPPQPLLTTGAEQPPQLGAGASQPQLKLVLEHSLVQVHSLVQAHASRCTAWCWCTAWRLACHSRPCEHADEPTDRHRRNPSCVRTNRRHHRNPCDDQLCACSVETIRPEQTNRAKLAMPATKTRLMENPPK